MDVSSNSAATELHKKFQKRQQNQRAAPEAPSGVIEGSASVANVTCSLDTGSDAETCALNPTPVALVSPPKKAPPAVPKRVSSAALSVQTPPDVTNSPAQVTSPTSPASLTSPANMHMSASDGMLSKRTEEPHPNMSIPPPPK